jgi:hypothetical protein
VPLDPDVDSVAVAGGGFEEVYPDRVVWRLEEMGERFVDAAIIEPGCTAADTARLVAAARRFVYDSSGDPATGSLVVQRHPAARASGLADGVRFELAPGAGYRVAGAGGA